MELRKDSYSTMTSLLHLPEERVVLYTYFPEAFGRSVIRQFKSNSTFKLFKLWIENDN